MPPKINNNNEILQGIKERSESYLSTIHALHAFVLAIERNSPQTTEIFSSIGRRMDIGPKTKKRHFCTPDLVVQINMSEGIVAEAKLLICKNDEDRWNKYITQIKKYDQELIGWWTGNEKIKYTGLVWITELTFSSRISDYFESKINSGEIHFVHPVSIIEFSQLQRLREYLFLRTRWGVVPSELQKVFADGIEIAMETLVLENKEKKFYDAKPADTEYTMETLWQNIFTNEAINNTSGLVQYDSENKIWRIPVKLGELTISMQKLFGSVGNKPREVQYPQTSWIKEALDKFVLIRFAEKGSEPGEYTILFKRLPRPMEKFVSLLYKKKTQVDIVGKQLELFQASLDQSVNQNL